MAHITGGGLVENVPRVLPHNCRAIFHKESWPKLPIFELLREGGNIPELEMYRTFNYGIGMILIVPAVEVDDVMSRLTGLNEQPYLIGEIVKCSEGGEQVELV
jgi:phosphoribosylformylglycinamidine cyclo-ligase